MRSSLIEKPVPLPYVGKSRAAMGKKAAEDIAYELPMFEPLVGDGRERVLVGNLFCRLCSFPQCHSVSPAVPVFNLVESQVFTGASCRLGFLWTS